MQHLKDPNGSDAFRASKYASTCIVTGRSSDPKGFIDTRQVVDPGNRPIPVLLSVAAVEEMARLIGWASPAEIEELAAVADEAKEKLAELKGADDRVRSLQRDLESFAAEIKDLEPETEKEKAAA